ncbi:hypothetical protein [uncultured Treponema sp.]|uniref:hypothetical protein n=1 Tax=uncultured Treponema sp. TaxID=162155 RepID=UPI0025F8C410|nr:hypothetical protein [uncultured Treponema sp.]
MKPQANKKNTAKFTAALFALILLFPCCMDSGSGGNSDYDSGSNTENNGSQENPDDRNEPDAPENPDNIYSANVESSVVVNLDGTCTVYVENELAGENISTSEIKELIRGKTELCVADKMSGYGYITPSVVNLTVKYSVKDDKKISNTEYRTYVLPPFNAVISLKDGFIYGASVNLVQNLDAISRSEQSSSVEVLISDDGKTVVDGVALESAAVDPEAEYVLKPTGSKVNVIAFIAAKKKLTEKSVKNITCAYNSSTANFFLDFSENGFGETIYQKLGIPYGSATSKSNAYFEWDDYGKAFNLPSNYSDCIKTDEYDRHTEIDGVDFLEKPFYYYVWSESYGGNTDCSIPKAFVFGEEVSKVDVSFGKEHNLIDAYKGGIILKNPDAKITSINIGETTFTGMLNTPTIDYDKKLRKFNENTLISYLYTESNLPNLSFDVNFFNTSPEEDNFFDIGIDKLFENYYINGASDKISMGKASNVPFDAEEYLGGEYMYNTNGSYNSNAYNLDINIALLMAKKLTNNLKNVNVSGNLTSDVETSIIPKNVRFSGDVSGLTFTKQGNYGIIDFAGVGPKEIVAPSSKIIVNGVKNDTNIKIIAGRVIDFGNVDESLLKNVTVKDNGVVTVYTKTGSFPGSIMIGVDIKTGSSASTNRAWEEAGRNGTLPSDSLSKLDVKAKANNPLLQKLLDENRPVYG